ncbi:hypothetical protein PENSPDRAFT_666250 [Peniophora sp. CONT]|nr:hypothetical protein PENSPDRAFT_666250 [Peniophora sp. CONT]
MDLAVAEEAASRLRVNSIIASLGPRLFDCTEAIDREALLKGMRLEAATQAAISGALAIQGVPPYDTGDDVGSGFQDTVANTVDGGYDILEAEYRQIRGFPAQFPIPDSPSAPGDVSEIPAFLHAVSMGHLDLISWWEGEDAAELESEVALAGTAAHLFLTTERFGQAPPIRTHGRDGMDFVNAPDIVNTWEHLTAQVRQLRRILELQQDALSHAVAKGQRSLLAAYEHLYQGVPEAVAELLLSFCNAVSGSLAIQGVAPHIPDWRRTIQYESNTSDGDALQALILKSRENDRLLGSAGVDIDIDDDESVFRRESELWTARCGEKRPTVANWWDLGGDETIVDGRLATAGDAAQLYLSTERLQRFKTRTRPPLPAGPPALISLSQKLLAQTDSLHHMAQDNRNYISSKIEEYERHLLTIYCCLYPEKVAALRIPSSEICLETVLDFERVHRVSVRSRLLDAPHNLHAGAPP